MDISSSKFDDGYHGDGFEAANVEDALQQQVRGRPDGSIGRRVCGFECQREQSTGEKRAVMIGIAGKNEAVTCRLTCVCSQAGNANEAGSLPSSVVSLAWVPIGSVPSVGLKEIGALPASAVAPNSNTAAAHARAMAAA